LLNKKSSVLNLLFKISCIIQKSLGLSSICFPYAKLKLSLHRGTGHVDFIISHDYMYVILFYIS